MARTYRFFRGVLATAALLGLLLFAAWHALLWRMGEVSRAEGAMVKPSRWTRYKKNGAGT